MGNRHDRALDFHGPVDFAKHCLEQGAEVHIDAETGKMRVKTEKGFAILPGDPRYSYGQQRNAVHNLGSIGITFALIIIASLALIIAVSLGG